MTRPWTREEIDGWVHRHDADEALSARARHQIRLARQTIVRLCPEVPDYDEFQRRRVAVTPAPVDTYWRETATDEEIVAKVTGVIGAYWQRSISERPQEATPA